MYHKSETDKDVTYLWPTAQLDGLNGVRLINNNIVYDLLLCDREAPQNPISIRNRDTYGTHVIKLGTSTEHIQKVNAILGLVDMKDNQLGDYLCPFFDLAELHIINWSKDDPSRVYNCIRRDGLHKCNGINSPLGLSLDYRDIMEDIWNALTVPMGFFVGTDNPDDCNLCYSLIDSGGSLTLERIRYNESSGVKEVELRSNYETFDSAWYTFCKNVKKFRDKGGAFLYFERSRELETRATKMKLA